MKVGAGRCVMRESNSHLPEEIVAQALDAAGADENVERWAAAL